MYKRQGSYLNADADANANADAEMPMPSFPNGLKALLTMINYNDTSSGHRLGLDIRKHTHITRMKKWGKFGGVMKIRVYECSVKYVILPKR